MRYFVAYLVNRTLAEVWALVSTEMEAEAEAHR